MNQRIVDLDPRIKDWGISADNNPQYKSRNLEQEPEPQTLENQSEESENQSEESENQSEEPENQSEESENQSKGSENQENQEVVEEQKNP